MTLILGFIGGSLLVIGLCIFTIKLDQHFTDEYNREMESAKPKVRTL